MKAYVLLAALASFAATAAVADQKIDATGNNDTIEVVDEEAGKEASDKPEAAK